MVNRGWVKLSCIALWAQDPNLPRYKTVTCHHNHSHMHLNCWLHTVYMWSDIYKVRIGKGRWLNKSGVYFTWPLRKTIPKWFSSPQKGFVTATLMSLTQSIFQSSALFFNTCEYPKILKVLCQGQSLPPHLKVASQSCLGENHGLRLGWADW